MGAHPAARHGLKTDGVVLQLAAGCWSWAGLLHTASLMCVAGPSLKRERVRHMKTRVTGETAKSVHENAMLSVLEICGLLPRKATTQDARRHHPACKLRMAPLNNLLPCVSTNTTITSTFGKIYPV